MENQQPGRPSEPLSAILAELAVRWSIPDLAARVRLRRAPRMSHTLGRAFPATGEIRISSRVLESGSSDLVREVLIHEAAHVACRIKHGRVLPHGPEWRTLMRAAGYEPRVRFDPRSTPSLPAPRPRPLIYQHRCPACGWTGLARTTNRRWRCAACLRAGRSGRLEVRRLPGRGEGRHGDL